MSPLTHALLSWLTANAAPSLGRRARGLITLAGVVPDLDGVGAIPQLLTAHTAHPVFWGSDYHHVLGHNLLAASAVAVAVALYSQRRARGTSSLSRERVRDGLLAGALACAAFHLHLLCDLVGSRGGDGYTWPMSYGFPFTDSLQLSWSGQWELDAWPNVAITAAAIALTLVLAARRGFGPLEVVWPAGDRALVAVARGWLARGRHAARRRRRSRRG